MGDRFPFKEGVIGSKPIWLTKNILETLKEKVKKAESFNDDYDSLSDILKKKKE